MYEEIVVRRKAHLGELLFIFSYRQDVGADELTQLWCTPTFY